MNVYHMNCRNLRSLCIMLAAVVCLYIALNIIYITVHEGALSSDRADMGLSSSVSYDSSEKKDVESIAARLKFGKPDGSGKVEVVVSLDVKQLAQLLGTSDLSGLNMGHNAQVAENRVVIHRGSKHPPINVSYILHNPKLCDGLVPSGVSWILGIYSTPEQSDRRQLLRETWANVGLFRQSIFRTFFVMGRATGVLQDAVQAEFAQHHDIVQGDFVDVSRNATLKGVLALRYTMQYCTTAKYFIKANDDTFLNIFAIMQLLEASQSHQHAVVCPLWKENTMPILRDPKECMQWCVADDELPGQTHFPQYCAGLAFALSRELVSALYMMSLSTPYFWIDDVYITGLLLPEVSKMFHGIHYVDLISNFTLVEKDIEAEYENKRKSIHYTIAKIRDTNVYKRVWQALLKRLPPSQFKLLSDSAIVQST